MNISRWQQTVALLGLLGLGGCGDDGSASPQGSSSSGDAGTTADESSTSSGGPGTADETGTTAGEPELSRIEQILADLNVAMYECPDRVWPGGTAENYRSRQVLLVSVEEATGWMWNDQLTSEGEPPRVSTGPLDGLPTEWTAGTFNFGVINDIRTLGISLDVTADINESTLESGAELYVDFASLLTVHEAFHYLSDQDDWNEGFGTRRVPYPEPWEPRHLRAELTAALRATLEDDAELSRAAYWQQRMQAEFPQELADIRALEITEGSAEYATIVSSVLAVEGCGVSEADLMTEAVAHLDDGFLGGGFSGGREPYDLGVLAGLILRRDDYPGWELATEGGTPPVEQLLQGVVPVDQAGDADLMATVQQTVEDRNVEVGMEIDPMLDALSSPDHVRVVVSFAWFAGSFSLDGFYYLPELPGEPDVYLRLSALLEPPSGVAIELFDETSLAGTGTGTPCALPAEQSLVLTLPAEDVVVAGGSATSTAATATFTDLAVEEATDMMGLTWLCPQDAGGAAPPSLPPPPGRRARPSAVERLPDGRLRARL